ncbi:peptidylprolyl isomerase [Mucilaginibacter lappiensis]|uniref:PpiC domain-containing protein n=1 Tax=Mucilaginibacter lappiensis TaxID=354630 RepID=A0A841JID1_9SPHI|nr:peptidylprolyl isomerase [Mucilaginibacter lappiensis]MBB6130923.1 hypothetical protein [Mucilaginibacter lappiensis]
MKYFKHGFLGNSLLKVLAIILIGLTFSRCSKDNRKNAEASQTVIEIGKFRVSLQEFNENLESLKAKGLTARTGYDQLLDNYISTGLLIHLASKSNLEQNADYKRELTYSENELLASFAKSERLKSIKSVDYDRSKVLGFYKSNNIIDYIWVPKKQKDLSKEILDRLNSGSTVEDLVKSNKFNEWDSLHIQFYSNLSSESAILTEDMIDNIQKMKVGKYETFKTQSGYYLIKVINRSASQHPPKSIKTIDFNLRIANAIENGDTILDPYVVNKALKINDGLLSDIPFQITPLIENDRNNDTTDDPLIAEFFGKKIYKKQVMQQVNLLPVNIQSVFKNKSTRALKVLNLVLVNNTELYNKNLFESNGYKTLLARYLNKQLSQHNHKDTLAFLVKIIEDNLGKYGSGILKIPSDFKDAKLRNTCDGNQKNGISGITHVISNKEGDYHWVYDDNLPGKDYVKLNFSAIEKMEFAAVPTKFDQAIIAYSKDRQLKVIELKESLSRLTPETRMAISESGGLRKLIDYLMQTGTKSRLPHNSFPL